MQGARRCGRMGVGRSRPIWRAGEAVRVSVRCGRPGLIVVGASVGRCAPDAVTPGGTWIPRSHFLEQPHLVGQCYSASATSSLSLYIWRATGRAQEAVAREELSSASVLTRTPSARSIGR